MNELINTAMMLITVLLGFSTALMIIYGIYRVIKWYAKRNENRNYQKEIREYYMKPVSERLWDHVGELN